MWKNLNFFQCFDRFWNYFFESLRKANFPPSIWHLYGVEWWITRSPSVHGKWGGMYSWLRARRWLIHTGAPQLRRFGAGRPYSWHQHLRILLHSRAFDATVFFSVVVSYIDLAKMYKQWTLILENFSMYCCLYFQFNFIKCHHFSPTEWF